MAVEILTKQDLYEFRMLILDDIREILKIEKKSPKQWLKSREVRNLLHVSSGTLQTLRINKTLSYTKIGGTLYYDYADIVRLMEGNKVCAEPSLFDAK